MGSGGAAPAEARSLGELQGEVVKAVVDLELEGAGAVRREARNSTTTSPAPIATQTECYRGPRPSEACRALQKNSTASTATAMAD